MRQTESWRVFISFHISDAEYHITTLSIMYANQYLIHKVSYYSRAVLQGSSPAFRELILVQLCE